MQGDLLFWGSMSEEYFGGVYSAELPGGQAFGKVSIKGDKLILLQKSEVGKLSRSFSSSLSLLKLEMGGAGDRMLFLETPNGMKFYCSDPDFIKELKKLKLQSLDVQFKQIGKLKSKGRALLWVILLSIILVLSLLWSGRKAILNLGINQIPISWDQEIGELSFKQFELNESFVKDSLILNTLDSITYPLLSILDNNENQYNWKIHLVDGSDVNAFALPSGDIVIYTGLIYRASSINEVQGVLAHEIAHVFLRHGIKNTLAQVGLMSLVSLILGDLSGLILIGEQGAQLASLSFSRDFEREADIKGLELLRRASLDPSGLVSFFKSLQQMEQGTLQKIMKEVPFLSTHPATSERIENLNKLSLEKWTPNIDKIVTIDFKEFQENLRNRFE